MQHEREGQQLVPEAVLCRFTAEQERHSEAPTRPLQAPALKRRDPELHAAPVPENLEESSTISTARLNLAHSSQVTFDAALQICRTRRIGLAQALCYLLLVWERWSWPVAASSESYPALDCICRRCASPASLSSATWTGRAPAHSHAA